MNSRFLPPLPCVFLRASLFAGLLLIPSAPLTAERVEKGNLVLDGVPETPAEIRETLRRYENVRAAGLAGWHSADGGILIQTRFAETSQVHHVAVPLGARTQLTFYNEPVRSVAVRPGAADGAFLFNRDTGGDENFQIHAFHPADHSDRMLTDGRGRNGGALWNGRGDRFAWSGTARTGRDYDIYVRDAGAGAESRLVLEREGYWGPEDWSADGTRLIIRNYLSINDSRLHVLDVDSGEVSELLPDSGRASFSSARESADGRRVFFTSDLDAEFMHLRVLDRETGEVKILTGDIPWDVQWVIMSADRGRMLFIVNEGGLDALWRMNPESLKRERLAAVPPGQIFGAEFHPDGDRIALSLGSAVSPGDVHVMDLTGGDLVRWTASETGGLREAELASPTLIEYPTFDEAHGARRRIPAFYYRPDSESPAPVLINIHGGPESQYTPGFSAMTQYFVRELGLAVLAPNVRGSAGYGRSHLLLDNGFKREDSVRDIGALLDWIATRPELDPSRVVVMGGSYGGYMVLASMIHYGDRLAAGIEIVGISSFVTFLENTSDYRRDLRRAEYGDERDPEMRAHLEKISPLARAGEIRRPMLIGQGANDPRVPASESEQIVRAIRANGGEAWYMLALDEGHGFAKKSNRDEWNGAVAHFLKTHLSD